MKKSYKKPGKVNKGGPSGLVISLLVHAGAFMVAGLCVVFTVLPRPKPVFQAPPPMERPKMDLKKPQVKVKRSSAPKPSSRIVAKVQMAKMPDIAIPDLVGTGDGLLGGLGGVGDGFLGGFSGGTTPISVLGMGTTDGNDLVGTFYDFKRSASGSPIGFGVDYESSGEEKRVATSVMMLLVNKFIKSGCKRTALSRYFCSPRRLYAPCLVVSPTLTDIAPSMFDTIDSGGGYWMVHYKGKLVHKDGITFRFVCSADYYITILVDGEIVWAGVWNTPGRYENFQELTDGKYSPRLGTRKYFMGNDRGMGGEWITLEPGVAHDLDIVIGDEDGECGFVIAVEEKDADYPEGSQGNPILPIFKTRDLSHDMVDQIYKDLAEGEVSVTNGPVFNNIGSTVATSLPEPEPEEIEEDEPEEVDSGLRTWTFKTGETLDAVYLKEKDYYDKMALRDANGKEWVIKKDQFVLSDEDQRFLDLENAPELTLEFKKDITRKNFTMIRFSEYRPPEQRATFGVSVSQDGYQEYGYDLTVDVYAIGQEIAGNRYILLDRFSCPFRLTKENGRRFEFENDRMVRMSDMWGDSGTYTRRGEQYYGFLIVVKDVRGKVIAVDASNDWLTEHIDALEERYIGNYIDRNCERVYPSRPKSYISSTASDRS